MDLFKMINSFLSPEDPYIEAQKEATRGWGQAQEFQKPFFDKGLEQYPGLMDAIKKLMNPGQLQNDWASSYETSPFAKRSLDMNRDQGLEAASSMGLMGSSGALNNIQRGAGDIVSRDRQTFLDDLMKKYMTGIGLGTNLYDTGASTAGNLGSQAMHHGENMAGLKYGESAAPGQLFGQLLDMGIGLATGKPGTSNFGGRGGFMNNSNNFNR